MAEDDQNLVADEAVAEAGAPEWVPEKFRSNPEKFAEAYTNLEREFHATKQQNRAMEDNYMSLAAEVEELRNTPRVDPTDARSQLYERFENDPIETVALLVNQGVQQGIQQYAQQNQQQLQPTQQSVQNLAAAYAYNSLVAENPDVENYRDKIGDFIAQRPYLVPADHLNNPQALKESLDTVYKLVSQDDRLTAASQQAEQAAQASLMKQNAQSLSGSTGRPMAPDAEKAEWEAVMNARDKPYWK